VSLAAVQKAAEDFIRNGEVRVSDKTADPDYDARGSRRAGREGGISACWLVKFTSGAPDPAASGRPQQGRVEREHFCHKRGSPRLCQNRPSDDDERGSRRAERGVSLSSAGDNPRGEFPASVAGKWTRCVQIARQTASGNRRPRFAGPVGGPFSAPLAMVRLQIS